MKLCFRRRILGIAVFGISSDAPRSLPIEHSSSANILSVRQCESKRAPDNTKKGQPPISILISLSGSEWSTTNLLSRKRKSKHYAATPIPVGLHLPALKEKEREKKKDYTTESAQLFRQHLTNWAGDPSGLSSLEHECSTSQ